MLNQAILVGIVKKIEKYTKSILNVQLAVSRNYRDSNTGEYEIDYITVLIDKGLAGNVEKYLGIERTIAVKARVVQPLGSTPSLLAEKVSFID